MATTPFQIALDAAAAASRRFNGLPHDLETTAPDEHKAEMDSFIAASSYADMATPTTWSEFTQLLEHMTDEGLSSIDDDNAARLLMHARRLNYGGKDP